MAVHPEGAVIVKVPNEAPVFALIVMELFSPTSITSLAFPSIVAPPVICTAVEEVHRTLITPTPSSSVMVNVSTPLKVCVKISFPKMSIGMIS